MVETNDGFEIARRDLEIRGAGNLLGEPVGGFNLVTLLVAFLGACLLLFLLGLVRRRA